MQDLSKLLTGKSSDVIVTMVKYGLVVVIAAPIDLGGYIVLKSIFHIEYVLAATISFTASLIVNYFLSMAWVWKSHSGKRKQVDALVFAVIGFVGLGLTDLVVWLFTHFAGLNYVVSKLIAFCVVFFWSFGARHLLFKDNSNTLDPL